MSRIFYIVTLAFHIWMLIDAIQRRAQWYWFLIIILVPFGDLIYFVVIKREDFIQTRKRHPLSGPNQVENTRRNFDLVPSVENRLELAQTLLASNKFNEAVGHFNHVLETHPNENAALYGLGRCKIALDDPRAALPPLEKLTSQHPSYGNYCAWPDLIAIYHHLDMKREAESKMRTLVNLNSKLSHQLMLAELLESWGRKVEAASTAQQALEQALEQAPERGLEQAQHQDKSTEENNKDLVRRLKSLIKNKNIMRHYYV